ncbi:MAG: sulfatase [Polyangiaceae bacterium]|nr:sulfatase [Polyangiaceae bacterium]
MPRLRGVVPSWASTNNVRSVKGVGIIALDVLVCSPLLSGCDNNANERPAEPPRSAQEPPGLARTTLLPKPPEPDTPQRPTRPLNVLLLTVDALRSDMPWTGYHKPIAPNLTKLARKSVVYENHRSVSSNTAQSVATLLSGRYASTLYRTGVFFTDYFDSNEWITEAMHDEGIVNMAVHAHLYFDRASGLRQGFDIWKMVPGLTWNAQTDESVTSEKSVKEIIALLSDPKNTKGQFFLWSHLMDPHDQYVKHKQAPDFGSDNRGRYDSEVWHTDYWLGRLLAFAEEQAFWKDTAVIVSADHGEAFGEHGMYKHAFELWEVLTRVPLIVKAPGAEPKRIKRPRTHIDVAPTLLDLMGLPALEGMQGRSLADEIYGVSEPEDRGPILLQLAEDTNNPARTAIIDGDFKLIVFERGWKKLLFDLVDDPAEKEDLSGRMPDKVRELSEKLDEALSRLPVVAPFGGNKLRSGKRATGPKGPPENAETATHGSNRARRVPSSE